MMRCLVCLWSVFLLSRLCCTTASTSSMSLSLLIVVTKAGTRSTRLLVLTPPVVQVLRRAIYRVGFMFVSIWACGFEALAFQNRFFQCTFMCRVRMLDQILRILCGVGEATHRHPLSTPEDPPALSPRPALWSAMLTRSQTGTHFTCWKMKPHITAKWNLMSSCCPLQLRGSGLHSPNCPSPSTITEETPASRLMAQGTAGTNGAVSLCSHWLTFVFWFLSWVEHCWYFSSRWLFLWLQRLQSCADVMHKVSEPLPRRLYQLSIDVSCRPEWHRHQRLHYPPGPPTGCALCSGSSCHGNARPHGGPLWPAD